MLFKYKKNVKQDYIQHSDLSQHHHHVDKEDFNLNISSPKINRRVDPYLKSGPHDQRLTYINNIFRDTEEFFDE